jgi:hypothetical protein
MKIEALNSALFSYDNYESDFGAALDLSYNVMSTLPESCDTELHTALKKYAVGYCKGDSLPFRPRAGMVGIMCEKDGEKFWFHIEESTLNKLLKE